MPVRYSHVQLYTNQPKHLNHSYWHQQHFNATDLSLVSCEVGPPWIELGPVCLIDTQSFRDQGSFGFRLTSWALCHVPWPIFEPFLWCARCIVLLGVRLPSGNAAAMGGVLNLQQCLDGCYWVSDILFSVVFWLIGVYLCNENNSKSTLCPLTFFF